MKTPIQLDYCPTCGKQLNQNPSYPGGDPENGPAERRCPDDHPTFGELVEEVAMFNGMAEPQEWLLEVQQGGPDPNDPIPDEIRAAAGLVLEWLDQRNKEREAEIEEMLAEPEEGPEKEQE